MTTHLLYIILYESHVPQSVKFSLKIVLAAWDCTEKSSQPDKVFFLFFFNFVSLMYNKLFTVWANKWKEYVSEQKTVWNSFIMYMKTMWGALWCRESVSPSMCAIFWLIFPIFTHCVHTSTHPNFSKKKCWGTIWGKNKKTKQKKPN